MDKERMAELEKIEAHGAKNGWVAPMTEEDREFLAYSIFYDIALNVVIPKEIAMLNNTITS